MVAQSINQGTREVVMKTWIAALCLLCAWQTSAYAAEYGVRLGGMALTPSGTASLTAGALPATTLNLQQDMALNKDTLPYAEISAEWSQHGFYLSWLKTALRGTSNRAPFNFNGNTFSTGPYQFNVDLRMLDGGFTYYPLFIDRDTWRLRLGAELAVKSLRTRVQVKDTVIAQDVSNSAMIPSFGIRGDIGIKSWLTLRARYSTFRMNGSSLKDVEAMLDINPLIWYSDIYTINLFAGYRQLQVKLNAQSNGQLQTDTTLKGPIFGLRLFY